MGKKLNKPPVALGRPSLYTEELAEKICDLIMDGNSMRRICLMPGMPNRVTVVRWMQKDPTFESKCARAREWQADYMDDLVLDTANECTSETAQADKVKISAYQWRASKLKPKVYGNFRDDPNNELRLRHSGRRHEVHQQAPDIDCLFDANF
jgi:hypothetical protein